MSNEPSKGYRWIEVVVALTVVGLVAAVLMPAILAAREAARRQQCEDNLRIVSLAAFNYSDVHGRFPYGTFGSRELPSHQRFSWYLSLWGYIEGKPPKLLFDTNQAWDAEVNRSPQLRHVIDFAKSTEHTVDRPLSYLPLFSCPSASQSLRIEGIQVTQYVGMAGLGTNAAELAIGDIGVGMWGYDRQVIRTAITDGIADTLLILETGHELGPWFAGGPATVRGLDTTATPIIGAERQFGDLHSTASAAIADGSVRQINPKVDVEVLKGLITIAGEDNR